MTAGPGQGHWRAVTLVSVGTHGECGGRVLGPTHGGRRERWVRAVGGYRPCHPKTQLCVREEGPRPPGAHRARRAQLHPPAWSTNRWDAPWGQEPPPPAQPQGGV